MIGILLILNLDKYEEKLSNQDKIIKEKEDLINQLKMSNDHLTKEKKDLQETIVNKDTAIEEFGKLVFKSISRRVCNTAL